MKKNVSKVARIVCLGLLVMGLWGHFSVFAKSDSEKEQVSVDIDMQLESEEAGLAEEEDVFWDNLEELEDDFSDLLERINQSSGRVYAFQESAQEVRTLLDKAEDSLEKEDWNQAKKDMDNALSKLKSLKNSVDLSLGAGDFDEDEIEDEIISEPEALSQESIQKQEPIQQSEAINQIDMPEKTKDGSAGIISRFFNWIAELFS